MPPTHIVEFTPEDVRAMLFYALEQKGVSVPYGQGMRFSADIYVDDNGHVRLTIVFTPRKPRFRIIRGGAAG